MSVFPLPYLLLQLPFMQIGSTYRINVYTFNKTLEFAERIKRIDVCVFICVLFNVYLTREEYVVSMCLVCVKSLFLILLSGIGVSTI